MSTQKNNDTLYKLCLFEILSGVHNRDVARTLFAEFCSETREKSDADFNAIKSALDGPKLRGSSKFPVHPTDFIVLRHFKLITKNALSLVDRINSSGSQIAYMNKKDSAHDVNYVIYKMRDETYLHDNREICGAPEIEDKPIRRGYSDLPMTIPQIFRMIREAISVEEAQRDDNCIIDICADSLSKEKQDAFKELLAISKEFYNILNNKLPTPKQVDEAMLSPDVKKAAREILVRAGIGPRQAKNLTEEPRLNKFERA